MGTSSQSFDGSVVGFFSSPDSGEVLITNRQLIALFVATVLLSGLAFGLGVHAGSRMTAQVRLVNPGDLAVADRRAKLPVETAPVTDTIADAPATAPAPAVAATTQKVRELTPIEESALAAQKEQADKAANAAKAEKAEKEKAVAATGKLGPFMVQTSSWPDKAGAEKACGIWAQRGFGCATNPAEVKGKGTWYQVRIGAYPTADAARKALVQLKRDFGVNGMVAKAAQRV